MRRGTRSAIPGRRAGWTWPSVRFRVCSRARSLRSFRVLPPALLPVFQLEARPFRSCPAPETTETPMSGQPVREAAIGALCRFPRRDCLLASVPSTGAPERAWHSVLPRRNPAAPSLSPRMEFVRIRSGSRRGAGKPECHPGHDDQLPTTEELASCEVRVPSGSLASSCQGNSGQDVVERIDHAGAVTGRGSGPGGRRRLPPGFPIAAASAAEAA